MAPKLHPLRQSGDGDSDLDSPEAYLISALLEEGEFTPEKYHLVDDDIEAWRKLWDFSREYQAHSGVAPPMTLVTRQFPDFRLIPDVSIGWAANEVRKASASRDLRRRTREMLGALNDEDLEGAFAALEGVQRPRGHRKAPVSVFDHTTVGEDFVVSRIDVPFPTLGRATNGGIGPGELWYLAARLGQGKTWKLLQYAAKAAKCGYKVGVHSLEMPHRQVALRAQQHLIGKDLKMQALLVSAKVEDRKKALDYIASVTPGVIEILDPSHGRINTTTSVNESCHDYDLVIVDHAGLLMTSDGRRAIDDWRAMAVISNVLRETTLATSTPILAAAQINRQGETSSSSPPKASTLSQSDALGQDADVLVTMKRLSDRVMIHSAEKVRNGPNLRWYSRFEPDKFRFEEIPKEAAQELTMLDEDRKTSLD